MEDGNPKGHCARRKQHLHVRCAKQRGGGVGEHSPQAEVGEVVPPVVPCRTIGVHACPECSVRVLPVSDEVNHRVHHMTGTSPLG